MKRYVYKKGDLIKFPVLKEINNKTSLFPNEIKKVLYSYIETNDSHYIEIIGYNKNNQERILRIEANLESINDFIYITSVSDNINGNNKIGAFKELREYVEYITDVKPTLIDEHLNIIK